MLSSDNAYGCIMKNVHWDLTLKIDCTLFIVIIKKINSYEVTIAGE